LGHSRFAFITHLLIAAETGQFSRFTLTPLTMPNPACPACTLEDVLSHSDHWECATCGHEWPKEAAPEAARIVKDAHGNVLADGDTVVLIKDLKLRGGSGVLKGGTKAKNIRLVDGDHEIDCRVEGVAMALKACFVKKA
jgi:protein PhnA